MLSTLHVVFSMQSILYVLINVFILYLTLMYYVLYVILFLMYIFLVSSSTFYFAAFLCFFLCFQQNLSDK